MQLTKWQVITGAPCSGKSAVILELERLGCPVMHEGSDPADPIQKSKFWRYKHIFFP
jgi:predicted ATPase